jgi:uncharacterized protein YwgA
MSPSQRSAVLIKLIDRLRAKGSWCGETHVQKSTYFLQSLFISDLGFDFVLYKHGPYSFDLSDHLSDMKGSSLLNLEPQPYPYGPKLLAGDNADALLALYPKTLAKVSRDVDAVAEFVKAKGVSELEREATALFVTLEHPGSRQHRAAQLRKYKPHVDEDGALRAIDTIDLLRSELSQ